MIDIAELFNVKLPQALLDYPEKVNGIEGTFQVILSGEGGGEWFLDPVSDPPTCTPGTHEASATLKMSAENFQKLVADPKKKALSMLMWGDLKITGNKGLAMTAATKLSAIFGGK